MEFSIDKRRKLTTYSVLGGEIGHCDLAQSDGGYLGGLQGTRIGMVEF